MEDLSDIRSLPLSSLTSSSRRLLSSLLDSIKALPTEGPIRRHRDWRGLASLVNISTEVEANILNYNDKTGKVLELWMQNRAATVGELLDHLTILDRFDVYDDLIVSIREQQSITPENQVALPNNHNQKVIADDPEVITYEDRPGHIHKYHAYVLYADEDAEFVMKMKSLLSSYGFEICIKDNLLPGFASQYPPIAKLISERCQRIVLVYSPEFLLSYENSFFRDYAQAVSIERNQRRLLPIMYRQCELPQHLRIYHMLYFNTSMNNFWDRLVKTLEIMRYPSVNGVTPPTAPAPVANPTTNSHSAVNIVTESESENDIRYSLPPRSAPIGSLTPSNVSLAPSSVSLALSRVSLAPSSVSLAPSSVSLTQSLASLTMTSTDINNEPMKKKKRSFVRRCVNVVTRKKNKKKIEDTMTPVKQCCT